MADNQWVEDMLLKASGQFRFLPKAAPTGHRGWWPPYERDYKERENKTRIETVDVDLVDSVLDMMLRAPLDVKQRKVVWARVRGGKIRGWRRVGRVVGYSHEHARNRYYTALRVLADWMLSAGSK
jgi:hypothetical protein